MNQILDRLAALFGPDRIIDWAADLIPNVVAAVVIFLAFYLLWRILARLVRAVLVRSDIDKTAQSFIDTVLRYVLLTIAGVSALSQLGINTGSILASLGVAGLTIGFAAKDALSNLISGLFIFWDRPFVLGDLVEIAGTYGRVETITMRSTRVVTPDGRMLAVPNTTIVNSVVASYTNFPHLRLDIPMTVGLDEDYGKVAKVILGAVLEDPRVMPEPAPQVVMRSVNDYNVELQLEAWIHDEKEHIQTRLHLRQKVYEALRAASVQMPFETLQLAPLEVTTR